MNFVMAYVIYVCICQKNGHGMRILSTNSYIKYVHPVSFVLLKNSLLPTSYIYLIEYTYRNAKSALEMALKRSARFLSRC